MTTHQLARFDTNALNKALIGFDTLFNDFERRLSTQVNNNYPPYNIVKYDDDRYEIQIAVSGFEKEEVTVEIDQNILTIRGYSERDQDVVQYLYRGLAARDFNRSFTLADHMEVGEAKIKNGILTIELNRVVPEALKPRVLPIKSE